MKVRGIIPPMISPLLDRDTLDTQGLEHLIEHILDGGVHGIFLLGTTSEAPSLSYRLRRELIERSTQQINHRVPVLVGISDTSFTESLNMAKKAADCGADAVVLAPPYYFSAGQPELIEYIEHLCEQLPLPLYLYNMPGCTKISMDPDTVMRLSEIERIIGLKDSSGDLTYFNTIRTRLTDKKEFSLLIGPEELLAQSVLLGGDGGVPGGANLFPSLYVKIYHAAANGDLTTVQALQTRIMRISTTIYSTGQYGSRFIKSLKCALALKGICSDYMAEPFHKFRSTERQKVAQYLEQFESTC